ncbi:sulfatase family protein [Flavobacterium commune]|uniref:Arylsulfatase n=1 Tax=Flavobacterium commune TaxID=1306519 RepID=A0A1D9P642_9FLAO|nr:arylsulfatase [Flavobacterium commune]AOZ97962.1 arylsulfatase [Flavobacterium commune]
MIKSIITGCLTLITFSFYSQESQNKQISAKPNVIFIYADDLGYGDLSCYGATKLKTPNLDKLANQGVRFTNAHCTSATCTPSRYALLTGQYPWRKSGTGILPGDAALIIPTNKMTLPKLFQQAGYRTANVGKWHLGLGDQVAKNWNGEIKPGPNEVGFDYSFIFPATADRVPSVFMENHKVVALDTNDPIQVDYSSKVGNDPTGKEHPELLKMKSSPGQGHDNTIVNGIGRIGYMSGGNKARWVDEEVSTTFLEKAKEFIEENHKKTFFLYFALTEPHVPRMPATMFKGKSGLGYRGDAILQLDWTVGQIMKQLETLGINQNTMVIFTSDNGAVLDDGYQDEAVSQLNGHTPNGILRGGKYSVLEAGTRVPFILSWPDVVKPKVSSGMVCQMDLLASFSNLLEQPILKEDAPDSENTLETFLGKSEKGRTILIEQGGNTLGKGGTLAIVKDNWKFIPANDGISYDQLVGIETGNANEPQLYDLNEDLGEKNNLAKKFPNKVNELAKLLKEKTQIKE